MKYFLDLFSGIGGFALGIQRAGIQFKEHYFSDIEEYAIAVYKKRFPQAKPLGDIRSVEYEKLPKGNWIVTGGFPCQPHSIAGKKKGAGDERDLWPECARMLRELRPEIALFENVPGLFVSNGGRFFNRILSDISACGYDAEWQIISASDVGAKHLRKRVWIVCYPSNWGGYWRTPDANMERGKRSYENIKMRINDGKPLNLNDQLNAIEKGLIGTPTASMKKRSKRFFSKGLNPNEYVSLFPTPRANSGTGMSIHGSGGIDIQTAVQLWPTPMVADGNKHSPASKQGLIRAIAKAGEIKNKHLNAEWVEVLMGYPLFWTDIEKDFVTNKNYPSVWINGTWEENIPRVVTGQKNRIKRLKGLGNAIVPQIAEAIFKMIYEKVFNE